MFLNIALFYNILILRFFPQGFRERKRLEEFRKRAPLTFSLQIYPHTLTDSVIKLAWFTICFLLLLLYAYASARSDLSSCWGLSTKATIECNRFYLLVVQSTRKTGSPCQIRNRSCQFIQAHFIIIFFFPYVHSATIPLSGLHQNNRHMMTKENSCVLLMCCKEKLNAIDVVL